MVKSGYNIRAAFVSPRAEFNYLSPDTKKKGKPADLILEAVQSQGDSQKNRDAAVVARDNQLSLFDAGAYWSEAERSLPNEYARTALFTTRSKGQKRELLQNHHIFSVNADLSISYTGSELRAGDDQLVWQQIVHYAKRCPVGSPVRFSFKDMAEQLGVQPNSRSYTAIKNCIGRLATVIMMFRSKRHGSIDTLRMIESFKIREEGKKTCFCEVAIQPEMVLLFAGDHYTRVEWCKYRELSPISRRLYDYASSHKEPFPLKVETLHALCSSDAILGKKWNLRVREACAELVTSRLLADARLEDGKVYLVKHAGKKTLSTKARPHDEQ
jgi:hypothetical protein